MTSHARRWRSGQSAASGGAGLLEISGSPRTRGFPEGGTSAQGCCGATVAQPRCKRGKSTAHVRDLIQRARLARFADAVAAQGVLAYRTEPCGEVSLPKDLRVQTDAHAFDATPEPGPVLGEWQILRRHDRRLAPRRSRGLGDDPGTDRGRR